MNPKHLIFFGYHPVTIGLMFLGALFKIMHWSYAGIIFIFASLSGVIFTVLIFQKSNKTQFDYIQVIIISLYYLSSDIFVLSRIFHISRSVQNILFLISGIISLGYCLIWFWHLLGKKYSQNEEFKQNKEL